MKKIEVTYSELDVALREGKSVTIYPQGTWRVDGWFVRFVKWLFCLGESSMRKNCLAISSLFDRLERRPVVLGLEGEEAERQNRRYDGYHKVAEAALKRMEKYHSKKTTIITKSLQRKVVALSYRIEQKGEGQGKDIDDLLALALQWKEGEELHTENKLGAFEKEQLKKASRYEEFVDLLYHDSHLVKEFFEWTLRDCNPPEVFIQYPSVSKRLSLTDISSRVGRFAYKKFLSISSINKKSNPLLKKKVVTLPFEGRKVSILNEDKKVTFHNKYEVPIRTVFQDMHQKKGEVGEFEVFAEGGFLHWNASKLGYWDDDKKEWVCISVEGERWWERLPTFEEIPKSEVERRYHLPHLEDDEWVLVALGSRDSNKLTLAGSHGYEEVLIPDGKGSWKLYSWGHFPEKWASGIIEKLTFVGDTVYGTYNYPEPSSLDSKRQNAAVPFVCSEERGLAEMALIRSHIINARKRNLPFMLGWENCAHTPQTNLEKTLGKRHEGGRVPNLFIAPILSADDPPFFKVVKGFYHVIKKIIIFILTVLIFPWRSKVFIDEDGKKVKKSLWSSPCKRGYDLYVDGKVKRVYYHTYLPFELHRKILSKEIDKELLPKDRHAFIWRGHQHFQY